MCPCHLLRKTPVNISTYWITVLFVREMHGIQLSNNFSELTFRENKIRLSAVSQQTLRYAENLVGFFSVFFHQASDRNLIKIKKKSQAFYSDTSIPVMPPLTPPQKMKRKSSFVGAFCLMKLSHLKSSSSSGTRFKRVGLRVFDTVSPSKSFRIAEYMLYTSANRSLFGVR